jgi:hypothetical protein
VDEAVAYAEIWRAVFEDSRNARVRKRLARRTAWRSVAEVSGGVWAELPRTAEVAAVDVVQRPTAAIPRRPDAPATGPAISGSSAEALDSSQAEQPQRQLRAVVEPAEHGSLTDQVNAFLNRHVNPGDYAQLDETDDTYLLWTTARALNVDIEEIADDVRTWRRRVTAQARRPVVARAIS